MLGECNQHAVLQVDVLLPNKTPRIVKATRSTKRGQAPSFLLTSRLIDRKFSAGVEADRQFVTLNVALSDDRQPLPPSLFRVLGGGGLFGRLL